MNVPLRQTGTVIDKEVALASIAQGLAPAGAAPPLMLSTLERTAPDSNGSGLYIGAPLSRRRGAPIPEARPLNQQSIASSRAEVERLVSTGGFVSAQNSTLPIAAVPEGPAPWLGQQHWQMMAPQLPAHVEKRKETLRPYDTQAPELAKLAAANTGMGGGSNGVSAVHRV